MIGINICTTELHDYLDESRVLVFSSCSIMSIILAFKKNHQYVCIMYKSSLKYDYAYSLLNAQIMGKLVSTKTIKITAALHRSLDILTVT